jgi:hypothetical protein
MAMERFDVELKSGVAGMLLDWPPKPEEAGGVAEGCGMKRGTRLGGIVEDGTPIVPWEFCCCGVADG